MSGRKQKRMLLCGICLLMICLTACAMTKRESQIEKTTEETTVEETESPKADDSAIVWNGTSYVYNNHRSNFLFLGVDTEEKVETSAGSADAGQTDALFLVSLDRVTNELAVITIPRDTMTEIQFYGVDGSDLGKDTDHISLAYAYGDGGHESCKLSVEAVSNLLYQIPIQYYCSMSLDGIGKLTEAVNGLTVTVPNNSLADKVPEWTEGAEAELTPENTELFVRYRDTGVSQSALDRIERQKAFLQALSAKVKELSRNDSGIWAVLYEKMELYLTTNMGNDLFLQLGKAMQQNREVKQWTVPGEGRQGTIYDEYIVDDQMLYENVIKTFYEER